LPLWAAHNRKPPALPEDACCGAGKAAGIRPGDLVGAITGEAGIPSHALGAITIAETHALVEVPAALADSILIALRATKIRGQRVTVRHDRG
jgi:ATP-dependent RNA helicase DeaD